MRGRIHFTSLQGRAVCWYFPHVCSDCDNRQRAHLSGQGEPGSPALNLEVNGYIAACCMRIRTDSFVRLAGERGELAFTETGVAHAELDREPEPAGVPGPDGHGAGYDSVLGVDLLLTGHKIDRAAEARGVAGREQVLRSGGSGPPRPAH